MSFKIFKVNNLDIDSSSKPATYISLKKSIVILFLGLLVYNTVGFIINFRFVLSEWRHEMRMLLNQKTDDADLTTFIFKKTDFDASTHEFSRNNKRYDVVKTKISGDSLIVYCFQDDKETALSADFNDLLFQNTASNTDLQKKLSGIFKHLLSEYMPENVVTLTLKDPSVSRDKKGILTYFQSFFPLISHAILTPPPQYVG